MTDQTSSQDYPTKPDQQTEQKVKFLIRWEDWPTILECFLFHQGPYPQQTPPSASAPLRAVRTAVIEVAHTTEPLLLDGSQLAAVTLSLE
jgi:hypothetical protein